VGAHPWFYVVPYQPEIRKAMLELREREFQAGRYNPMVAFPDMAGAVTPGAQHDSIDEAREAADADGTRSIVDMDDVGTEPADPDDPQFGVVSPIDPDLLLELFGTSQPTREMLDTADFMEELERGTGVYIVTYEKGKPSEICFAGYSYD
jgi:hypothetical protein